MNPIIVGAIGTAVGLVAHDTVKKALKGGKTATKRKSTAKKTTAKKSAKKAAPKKKAPAKKAAPKKKATSKKKRVASRAKI